MPKLLTRSRGNACTKKERTLHEEKNVLTSAGPFRRKGLSSTQPPVLPSPLELASGLCLLLASRHAEARNMKTLLDMSTLNLDLLTTGDN